MLRHHLVSLPSGRTVCLSLPDGASGAAVKDLLASREGLPHEAVRLECDGRIVDNGAVLTGAALLRVHLVLLGGKGGFGSMLRAMGAMKSGKETDNIDACRGLDGRRLRHVEDERKIAEWVAKEPERKEAKARRKAAKAERKMAVPKHTFDHHGLAVELHAQSAGVDEAVRAAFDANRMPEAGGVPIPSAIAKAAAAADAEPQAKRRRMHWDEVSSSSSSDASSVESDTEAGTANVAVKAPTVATVATVAAPPPPPPLPAPLSKEAPSPSHEGDAGSATTAAAKRVYVRGPDIQPADLDLEPYTSAEELAAVGTDRLKAALLFRGAKCGGSLAERAERLFSLKGLIKTPSYLCPAKRN